MVCCQEEEYKTKNGVQHIEGKDVEIAVMLKTQTQVMHLFTNLSELHFTLHYIYVRPWSAVKKRNTKQKMVYSTSKEKT